MSDLFYLFKRGSGYYRHGAAGYCDRHEAGIFTKIYAQQEVVSTHGEVEAIPIDQPEEGSYILAANLEAVFVAAIANWVTYEHTRGMTGKTIARTALESNLAYLRKHGTLKVRP